MAESQIFLSGSFQRSRGCVRCLSFVLYSHPLCSWSIWKKQKQLLIIISSLCPSSPAMHCDMWEMCSVVRDSKTYTLGRHNNLSTNKWPNIGGKIQQVKTQQLPYTLLKRYILWKTERSICLQNVWKRQSTWSWNEYLWAGVGHHLSFILPGNTTIYTFNNVNWGINTSAGFQTPTWDNVPRTGWILNVYTSHPVFE